MCLRKDDCCTLARLCLCIHKFRSLPKPRETEEVIERILTIGDAPKNPRNWWFPGDGQRPMNPFAFAVNGVETYDSSKDPRITFCTWATHSPWLMIILHFIWLIISLHELTVLVRITYMTAMIGHTSFAYEGLRILGDGDR